MMIMLRRLDRSEDLRTTMLRLRGGSGSWCNANGDEPWRGDDPGDETEREISLWVSKPVKTSGPRGIGKRAAHWLFVKGGMSLVVILGLIALGPIAVVLGFR
jgi:hypothetical protein